MAGKSGCRDAVFFLATLAAIAGAAAYQGRGPFEENGLVLGSVTVPYGQFDGRTGEFFQGQMKSLEEQARNARIGLGDDCRVEIKLIKRTRP